MERCGQCATTRVLSPSVPQTRVGGGVGAANPRFSAQRANITTISGATVEPCVMASERMICECVVGWQRYNIIQACRVKCEPIVCEFVAGSPHDFARGDVDGERWPQTHGAKNYSTVQQKSKRSTKCRVGCERSAVGCWFVCGDVTTISLRVFRLRLNTVSKVRLRLQ